MKKGVSEELDLSLQIVLWNLVYDLKMKNNYLQFFKLSKV